MSKGLKISISFPEKRSLLSLPPTVYELSIRQSIQQIAEVRLKSILLYEVFHQRCCFYLGYY